MPEPYKLDKSIWTEADFDTMGRHDATIHAIAFFPDTFEFALDLDYVFQWIAPESEGGDFSFRRMGQIRPPAAEPGRTLSARLYTHQAR